jgi:hypothetical protein
LGIGSKEQELSDLRTFTTDYDVMDEFTDYAMYYIHYKIGGGMNHII